MAISSVANAGRSTGISKKYTDKKNKFSIKAKGLALSLRPFVRLAQDEEPGRACGEAGS
jgi:hypothetical protein